MSGINSLNQEQLITLIEIQEKLINSSSNKDALMVRLAESLMHLFLCSTGHLIFFEGDGKLHLNLTFNSKGVFSKNLIVEESTAAGYSFVWRKSLIIQDVSNCPKFFPNLLGQKDCPTKNMLVSPVIANGQCFGVIELVNKTNGNWNQQDVIILEKVSQHFAILLDRILQNQLFESLKSQVAYETDAGQVAFIHESSVMGDVYSIACELAKTSGPVLIYGEKGTGKDTVAKLIHSMSSRREKNFIKVDCSMSLEDFEKSVLKGFQGTVYLDFVEKMSQENQHFILNILQNSRENEMPYRFIASTSCDIEVLVNSGCFSKELYLRLNGFPVNIPPLRSRREDIAAVSQYYLILCASVLGKNTKFFLPETRDFLFKRTFSCNLWELKSLVFNGVLNSKGENVSVLDLFTEPPLGLNGNGLPQRQDEVDKTLKSAVNRFKKSYITQLLEENEWNQTKVSKILDVQRTYVTKLMADLGIKNSQ